MNINPLVPISLISSAVFLILLTSSRWWETTCSITGEVPFHVDFVLEGIGVGGTLFFLKELILHRSMKERRRGNFTLFVSMLQMAGVFGMLGTRSYCIPQPQTYIMILCGRPLQYTLFTDVVNSRRPVRCIQYLGGILAGLLHIFFMTLATLIVPHNNIHSAGVLVLAGVIILPVWINNIREYKLAGNDPIRRNRNVLRLLVVSLGFFTPMWLLLSVLFNTHVLEAYQLELATCILYGCSNVSFAMTWCAQINVNDQLQIQSAVAEKDAATIANRAKRLFMRYIFHELRVPLNAIVLGLGVVHESAREIRNDEILDTTVVLQVNALAMSKLLDDFLSLEKIEEGKFVLEIVQFVLVDMVNDAVKLFEIPLAAKRLSYELDLRPDVPSLLSGDVHKLRQVLSNYISNAIKFSPNGNVITITVENEKTSMPHRETAAVTPFSPQKPSAIRFSVTDHGPGVSSADQAKLFQPFHQIHAGAIQKGNGTGLGLSICKRIIELSNGRVGVTSKEGEGATFFFVIPVGDTSGASSVPVSPVSSVSPNDIPVKKIPLRVAVVVDDVQSNRDFFGRILQRRGVSTVYYAEDGIKALSLLDSLSAEAVAAIQVWFLDKEMPNCDGHECVRKLRSRNITTTVLGVTANALEDDIAQFIAAGVSDVIIKPITIDVLRKVLSKCGFSLGV